MDALRDVSKRELKDELGRRELSEFSQAMFKCPVETVEEYRCIRRDAQTYMKVFAKADDPARMGLKVALLFRLFDKAQERQDEEKKRQYKKALDHAFSAVCP